MFLKKLYAAHGSDGKLYEIHVYAEAVDAPGKKAAHPSMEALTTICTSAGETLEVLGKGHYEIPDTGVTLRSDDPEAV
ncbi:MAG: hypothetical protein WBV61_06050 [Rhodanobacteraceae bacterium]